MHWTAPGENYPVFLSSNVVQIIEQMCACLRKHWFWFKCILKQTCEILGNKIMSTYSPFVLVYLLWVLLSLLHFSQDLNIFSMIIYYINCNSLDKISLVNIMNLGEEIANPLSETRSEILWGNNWPWDLAFVSSASDQILRAFLLLLWVFRTIRKLHKMFIRKMCYCITINLKPDLVHRGVLVDCQYVICHCCLEIEKEHWCCSAISGLELPLALPFFHILERSWFTHFCYKLAPQAFESMILISVCSCDFSMTDHKNSDKIL